MSIVWEGRGELVVWEERGELMVREERGELVVWEERGELAFMKGKKNNLYPTIYLCLLFIFGPMRMLVNDVM